ncbi:TonB-dependent receptor plug domain-containing protein [Gluconacetobacter sp. Hr-1-5]|uniref:TonB-dependent receptor plug domain-containing protein n=1 Tax=Gluconacetobacter sp. Hr-1-5 TaxID=3395370 RepID=UPI003B5159D0
MSVAHGQESALKSPNEVLVGSEEVSVSGQAAPGNSVLSTSTKKNSTTQVFVFSSKQLQQTGQTNIMAALAQLSPAVTSSPFSGMGGNGFNRTMQLRNLSADQTLILVNGKRRHVDANFNYQVGSNYGTEPTDISLIPMSAIDHIEIITEGASALYGQDAIAGAVNIVLKSDKKGGTTTVQNSGYYPGDGQGIDGTASYALPLGHNGGYFDIAGQITNQLPTNRSGDYLGQLYFDPNDPRNQSLGRNLQRFQGIIQSRLEAVSINTAVPISPKFEWYGTYTYSRKDSIQAETYRAPMNDNVVRALHPNGMEPRRTAAENDFQINNGFRSANFMGMQWDAYATYGRDQMRYGEFDTDNPTYGVDSPTTFYKGTYIASELTAGIKSTKYIHTSILPRPINVSFGFEYRHDTYQLVAGQPQSVSDGGIPILDGPDAGMPASAGAVDDFGIPQIAAGTLSRGVYDGSVNVDLFATRKWEWTLGGHVAAYSDEGIAPTGSIGTRYNFNKHWAIRANANTGYRPPTLGEEGFFAETTFPTYRTAQLPVNSPWARALGEGRLKGESSRSFSVGLDASITDNWTLTANLYRISINDRLYNTSQFGGSEIQNLLTPLGLPGVEYASYYANPVNTATNGGDVSTSYTLHASHLGLFRFSFSVNISDTQISKYNAAPPLLAAMGQPYFNRTNVEYLLHSNPRNTEMLTVYWQRGPWSINAQEVRYGSYTYVAAPSLTEAQWTHANPSFITNLEVGYDFMKKWHVAVGAYNLGNKYPTRANSASRGALQNAFTYAANSPYGFSGGQYYVKASVKF